MGSTKLTSGCNGAISSSQSKQFSRGFLNDGYLIWQGANVTFSGCVFTNNGTFDDNSRMRKMMRSIYSPHFDEIIECDDRDKAIAEFNNELPDWVVMDIKMNDMDGIEATEKIISTNPDAKVIIVSQYNDETTIDAVKKAGAIEFVSKENLYKVIEVINQK